MAESPSEFGVNRVAMNSLRCSSPYRHAAGIRPFESAQQLSASVWQFGWRFDHDDAAFMGHFPHEPILAGVFLLEMAQRAAELALQTSTQQLHRVRSVERFRFLTPVLPGDSCTLRLEWPEDASSAPLKLKASFSKQDTRIAYGSMTSTLATEPNEAPRPATPFVAPQARESFRPDALGLLRLMPHRYPMLLVDRVEAGHEGTAVAFKNITFSEPCFKDIDRAESLEDLAYPVSLLVESFGQGAGVLLSRRGFLDKAQSSCVVVFGEFERIELFGDAHPGDCLRHEVRLDYSGPQLALLSGRTLVDGRVIATFGSLKAFLVDKASLERQVQHA